MLGGVSYEFIIERDPDYQLPFQETNIGFVLPVVPFNNEISVTFTAKALVSLQPSTPFENLAEDYDFQDY